ncbi:MAG: hypothetical protein HRU12_23800 [Phaeodactylibacter sp.]|nr:hypothetical protein [Phaeodactylibacter sp.]
MIVEIALGIVVGFIALAFLPYVVGLVVVIALAILPWIPTIIGALVSQVYGNPLGLGVGLVLTAAIYYKLREE